MTTHGRRPPTLPGMTTPVDVTSIRATVARALVPIRHDRWLLGGLRDGRLRVIAQQPPPPDRRPGRDVRPIYADLSPLARRCLYERHPVAVASMLHMGADDNNWEESWPSVLYIPVGLPHVRPAGLLVIGSRTPHWYTQGELDFLGALAAAVADAVAALCGPLGRLTPRERRFALLIAQGLSDEEIAVALALDGLAAQRVSGGVLRKLCLRSRHELRDLVPAGVDAPVSDRG